MMPACHIVTLIITKRWLPETELGDPSIQTWLCSRFLPVQRNILSPFSCLYNLFCSFHSDI